MRVQLTTGFVGAILLCGGMPKLSIAVQHPKEDRRHFLKRLATLVGAGGALGTIDRFHPRPAEAIRHNPNFVELEEQASDVADPGFGKGRMYVKAMPSFIQNIPFYRDENGYIQHVLGSDGTIMIAGDSVSDVGQGGWRWAMNASQIWNAHYGNFNSHNDGDNVTYKIWLAKGSYTIRLVCVRGTSRGICDIDIDGGEVASFDMYLAVTVFNAVFQDSWNDIHTNGLKELRLRVDGKNASSTDHRICWSYIALWRNA